MSQDLLLNSNCEQGRWRRIAGMDQDVRSLGDDVHSGKHTKNSGKSPCFIGKSTISMAMFNSYVSLPGSTWPWCDRQLGLDHPVPSTAAGPSWPSSWLKRDVAASRWILIIKLRSRTHFSVPKKSKYINIPWSRHSQLVFVCIYVLNTHTHIYIYISLSYIHRTNLSLEGSLQLPGIPCTWLWNHCWREETVKTTGFLW